MLLLAAISCPAKGQKLAEIGDSASISGDGQTLVYAGFEANTAEYHVFILDRRTGETRQLTRSGADEEVGDLRLSRDGKQVVYEWLLNDGTLELRLVCLSGGPARVVMRGGNRYRWIDPADWSPDGTHIAVWLRTREGESQLGVLSPENGSLRVLKTFSSEQRSGSIRFSPDGRYLAYTAQLHPNQAHRDIAVISLDDGSELIVVGDTNDDFLLDWMPDGKQVLFSSNREGRPSIWIAEFARGKSPRPPRLAPAQVRDLEHGLGLTADGSFYYTRSLWTNNLHVVSYDPVSGKAGAPENLAADLAFDSAAQLSPDGKYLAYFRGSGYIQDPFTLTLRGASGSGKRRLDLGRLRRFGSHAIQPQWSPDSHFILVQGRDRDFTGPGKDSQGLYRIDAETGKLTPILRTSGVCPPDCLEWPVWSRDGRAIFMRWLPPGGRSREPFKAVIVALELESGEEKLIYQARPTAHVYHLAASPDGKYLAFVEEESDITSPERHVRGQSTTVLKVVPLTGGAPRELARLPPPVLSSYGQPVFELAWTPDSRYIIYAPTTAGQQPKFELWRVPRIGGEPRKLNVTLEGRLPYGLSVHPDGRRIVFTAGTPQRTEVWMAQNYLEQLQQSLQTVTTTSLITFDSERGGKCRNSLSGMAGLLLSSPVLPARLHQPETPPLQTTSKLRSVEIKTTEVTEADVAISPDGHTFGVLGHHVHTADFRILFDSTHTGSNEIHVMNADGSNVRQLTNVGKEGVDSRVPGWSPDRKRIVFQSNRDGNPELYVMDAEGGNVRRLTHSAEEEGGPAWSPDGEHIAYDRATRDASGDYVSSRIWVIEADGSGAQPLTSGKSRDWHAAWSPDGQRLAFVSNRGGEFFDIWVMDADGSNPLRLTQNTGTNAGPAWSPGGKQIAFDSTRDRNWELYLMDRHGSNIRRLTNTPDRSEARPAWSPDGRRIAFNAGREGAWDTYEICVIEIDGSNQHCLTNNDAFDAHPDWR